jgi:hypothetical protein
VYHTALTKINKGVAPFTMQQLQQAYNMCFKGVMLVTLPVFPYFLEKHSGDPAIQAFYIAHFKAVMDDFADNLERFHSLPPTAK